MCNLCPSMIVTDENKLRLEVSMEVSHQIHEALRSLENMDEMLANIDREVANCGESKVKIPGSSPKIRPPPACQYTTTILWLHQAHTTFTTKMAARLFQCTAT